MADIIIQNQVDLRDCLTRIGFGNLQRDAIVREGFLSLEDLGDFALKDVDNMCKKISTIPATRGGVHIGYALVRKLKGLIYWVKDHLRRDLIPEEGDWTLDVCKFSIRAMDIEEARNKDDTKIDAPGKLKAADWQQWELKLINFLQSMHGSSGVPLHYVIRKDVAPGYVYENNLEELVNTCPLAGMVFDEDNRKVFGIIKQGVADTNNWDWIKTLNRSQDGRLAMQMLRDHFDGPGEVEKRIATANKNMAELHYVKESTFPFSQYVTGLNACYKTLEEAGEPITERNKVSTMIKGISTQNQYLTAAIQNVRTNPNTKSNFTAASNELGEQIAIIFPGELRRSGGGFRGGGGGRRMSGVGRGAGRGGSGRGRGHGRGSYQGGRGGGRGYQGGGQGGRGNQQGRGRGGGRGNETVTADGVDVTNVTRSFTDQEWSALSSESRRYVHEERETKRARTGQGGAGRGVGAVHNINNNANFQEPNNNAGAGRGPPGFGRGAYQEGRGRARGRGHDQD
jgi:hypothetical protein